VPLPVAPWTAVVPVKRLGLAKSRLSGPSDEERAELALAFALDVVSAALEVPAVRRVLVVTSDPVAAAACARNGAGVVADRGAGLNAALLAGAGAARTERPGDGVLALTADLPAARTEDLAAVLAGAGRPCCVHDAEGTGTTLLAAPAGHALRPRFGTGSAARHRAAGAPAVPAAAGLRRDVDTVHDLDAALRLGVGPRTSAVALRLRLRARG
jgi:2-phospho-L-lactate guanylyltransferase